MGQRNYFTLTECKTLYRAIERITESREDARNAMKFILRMVRDL